MENKKQLEDINKETLAKFEAYIKERGELAPEHHEKINSAKEKWQAAWNEFLETLMVLEKLEI